MDWLLELIAGTGVAHSIFLLAVVIAIGLLLGKVKIFGISLGTTWILFAGIILGHFGLTLNDDIMLFMKEFGLILFIYSIGIQVGPSFFSSFKKGGLTLNLLAIFMVLSGVVVTLVLHYVTNIPMPTMVGILSGAVTNTPGLGAAEQAYFESTGASDPTIATAYAVSYPLAVVGIIMMIVIFKSLFKVDIGKETKRLTDDGNSKMTEAHKFSLVVENPAVFGKDIYEIKKLAEKEFVISRVLHTQTGEFVIPHTDTKLYEGDKILVVSNLQNINMIEALIGKRIEMDRNEWHKVDSKLISRRITISKSDINGKTVGSLKLRNLFGVNITRVNRAGVDLVADVKLKLQLGDRVTVVGTEEGISGVEKIMGNSLRRLNHPNLIFIFVGIALGVLVGSIPFTLPGIPQSVKLGLAGGPLIVAILISRFGPSYKIVTYTTMSANLMLREIGISIFLACVGLGAGETFIETLVNGGFVWIGYGLIITLVPVIIVGILGKKVFKLDFLTLTGVISGSMTNPPSLAYANSIAGNDVPSVSYATVYPLTMFLRVVSAQLLILMFL